MEKEMKFTQEWLEKNVRKALNKNEGTINQSDMQKIKYLKIGETFCNDFFVEMSTQEPPMPFVDTDGGDEWGCACLTGNDIARFLETEKDRYKQLYLFGFEHSKEDVWSEEAKQKWNQYKQNIIKDEYYEKIEDNDKWEKWYQETCGHLAKDLTLFSGVEVLRINGLSFEDYEFLKQFPNLQVLEVVETSFEKADGMEELKKLKQLCCWLD